MKKVFATLLIGLLLSSAASAQGNSGKKVERKQFIYVLKLVPRLLNEKNWTTEDNAIVGRHFRRLQKLHKEGKVILAGRTTNEADPSQFGVVILEVNDEDEARRIMLEDDAVKEKIMTAELFPFSVALIR